MAEREMRRIDLVSAVIPVYNRSSHIDGAIASVLNQSLPNGTSIELIVVDDGSNDGTAERVESWVRRDSRVSLLRIGRIGTPGGVRNRGVAAAGGEVLAFLDSDDRWYPGKIMSQLPLHATKAVFSHTRERWMREERREGSTSGGAPPAVIPMREISQARQNHRRAGDPFRDALRKCIIGPSTVMIDRGLYDRLGGFRDDLEVAEDYEFWLRVLSHVPVAYVDEVLTEKRAGRWDQLSERSGHIEGFRLTALRDLVDTAYFRRFRSEEDQRMATVELVRKMRVFAAGARKRGRLDEALRLEGAANSYRI